jgi:glutaredoxin-like protein NrdH
LMFKMPGSGVNYVQSPHVLMDIPAEHIEGKNKGDVKLYALSTCIWCKKTRELLNELGIDYYRVYVDLLEKPEKDRAIEEINKWNPARSFPTLVINDQKCIVGYKPDDIRGALG